MSHTLQQRLDEYVAGISSAATLTNDLAAYCNTASFSVWETLALLDQYHRQGKLPTDLYRSISCTIQHRAMGIQQPAPTEVVVAEKVDLPAVAVAVADAAVEIMVDEVPVASSTNYVSTDAAAGQTTTTAALAAEILSLREQLSDARRQAALYREQASTVGLQQLNGATAKSKLSAVAPLLKRGLHHLHLRAVPTVALLGCCVAMAVSKGLGDPAHEAALASRLAPVAAPPPAAAPQPGTLNLSASRFIAYPQARSVEIVVRRTGGTDGEVSFEWWGQNAGAKSGRDFAGKGPRRLRIPNGADSASLSIQILRNPERKHTELFYVVLGKPAGGATLGDRRRAPVFIMRP